MSFRSNSLCISTSNPFSPFDPPVDRFPRKASYSSCVNSPLRKPNVWHKNFLSLREWTDGSCWKCWELEGFFGFLHVLRKLANEYSLLLSAAMMSMKLSICSNALGCKEFLLARAFYWPLRMASKSRNSPTFQPQRRSGLNIIQIFISRCKWHMKKGARSCQDNPAELIQDFQALFIAVAPDVLPLTIPA